jgi:hypothetical protein
LGRKLDHFFLFQRDGGLRVLEIEARVDFLGGLVNGVLYLLNFYFAYYVEALIGCHISFPLRFPLCPMKRFEGMSSLAQNSPTHNCHLDRRRAFAPQWRDPCILPVSAQPSEALSPTGLPETAHES